MTCAQEDPCAIVVPGQVFCDDFNDGDAEDGLPATWAPEFPATYDASSGDYVLSADESTGVLRPMISAAADHLLTDTSIRAQVHLQQLGHSIGIEARRDSSSLSGYWHAMQGQSPSRLVLYRNAPGEGGFTILGEQSISFDVTQDDVLLQLDVEQDKLRGWIWRPGESMPANPQIDVQDAAYTEGVPSLWMTTNGSGDGVGVFRWVQVSETHIPEPSTAVLSCLGFAAVVAWQRRKRLAGDSKS